MQLRKFSSLARSNLDLSCIIECSINVGTKLSVKLDCHSFCLQDQWFLIVRTRVTLFMCYFLLQTLLSPGSPTNKLCYPPPPTNKLCYTPSPLTIITSSWFFIVSTTVTSRTSITYVVISQTILSCRGIVFVSFPLPLLSFYGMMVSD